MACMNNGSYNDAAKKFEDLDRDHPYAPEARRAIVMAAYAYYKAGKYPEAIASAKRYTTLHPGTKDAALAHHIIASANFDEIKDPARDQTATRKALAELKTLVQRYPDSPYTKQANNRIRLAEDLLAARGDERRPLLPEPQQPRGRHQPLQDRGHRIPDDGAGGRGAVSRSSRPTWRWASSPRPRPPPPCSATTTRTREWYKNAYALLKSGGLSPQVTQGTWLSNAIKAVTPGHRQKKPEAEAGARALAGHARARGYAGAAHTERRAGLERAVQAAAGRSRNRPSGSRKSDR